MTHSCVWCDSFTCVAWSSVCATLTKIMGSLKLWVSFAEYLLFYRALLQKRPIVGACGWCDSFTEKKSHEMIMMMWMFGYRKGCVCALLCHMTHACVWCDSFTCVTWLSVCGVTYSKKENHQKVMMMGGFRVKECVCAWVCDMTYSCVAWLIHVCDMTHSCVTWCRNCVKGCVCSCEWDVTLCDMTHSYSWRSYFW